MPVDDSQNFSEPYFKCNNISIEKFRKIIRFLDIILKTVRRRLEVVPKLLNFSQEV